MTLQSFKIMLQWSHHRQITESEISMISQWRNCLHYHLPSNLFLSTFSSSISLISLIFTFTMGWRTNYYSGRPLLKLYMAPLPPLTPNLVWRDVYYMSTRCRIGTPPVSFWQHYIPPLSTPSSCNDVFHPVYVVHLYHVIKMHAVCRR